VQPPGSGARPDLFENDLGGGRVTATATRAVCSSGRLVDDGEDLDLAEALGGACPSAASCSRSTIGVVPTPAPWPTPGTPEGPKRGCRGVAARVAGHGFAYTDLNKLPLESPVIAGFRYLA
jgi:hypothetical protein